MATVAAQAALRPRRESPVPLLLGLAVVGVVATAATAWTLAHSSILSYPIAAASTQSANVAFWVGAGIYVWWREPASRLGPLMTGLGFLYTSYSLSASGNAVVYSFGMTVWAAQIVASMYVYLSFPDGRLQWRVERWFVGAVVLVTALVWLSILAVAPTLPSGSPEVECGSRCPHNGLQIVSGGAGTATALATALSVVLTLASLGVATLIVSKARSSSHMRRRMMVPVAVVVIAAACEFVIAIYVDPTYPGATRYLLIAAALLSLAVPIAMLVGLAQGRSLPAISLGKVLSRANRSSMTPDAVQKIIADSLGDSTLKLAMWAPERACYIDAHGVPVELPPETSERRVTLVTRDERPVAALIHKPLLHADPDVVEGLTATSLMLLENARLVEEVRASRARIATAANEERVRMERDLHDGAQQRLMAIQIKLRMAQQRAPDQDLAGQLEAVGIDAGEAVEELRALARGLYPSTLRDGGLPDAFRALAMREPAPIHVNDLGIGRCSVPTEGAVYFCALEAVQNAIKHGGRGVQITITLGRERGCAYFTVEDDGVGMDVRARTDGLGLVSMRDRVSAVGGRLEISSSRGRGTCVRGSVPDEQPQSEAVGP